jgi:hypothetical protein
MRQRRIGLVVALLGGGLLGCAATKPPVTALLADHHYAEAICAADSEVQERAAVEEALANDAVISASARVLGESEMQGVLGDKTGLVASRYHVVQIALDSNILPVDDIGVFSYVHGDVVPDPPTLADITGEPHPPRVPGITYMTGPNMLRMMGAVVMPFLLLTQEGRDAFDLRGERVLFEANAEAFRATAPTAMRFWSALRGQCTPLTDVRDPAIRAGVRCQLFALAGRFDRSPLELRTSATFFAKRLDSSQSSDPSTRQQAPPPCSIRLENRTVIGYGDTIRSDIAVGFQGKPKRLVLQPPRF